jgi:hypothetical protein
VAFEGSVEVGDISGEIGVNHTCGLMAAHYQGGVPDIEDPSACHRWFYVSRCLLPANWVDAAVADIVKVSRIRNDSLRLTGALLFTGRRFAQYIEGAAEHVAAVQESIKRDARHGEVQTILAGAGEGDCSTTGRSLMRGRRFSCRRRWSRCSTRRLIRRRA